MFLRSVGNLQKLLCQLDDLRSIRAMSNSIEGSHERKTLLRTWHFRVSRVQSLTLRQQLQVDEVRFAATFRA